MFLSQQEAQTSHPKQNKDCLALADTPRATASLEFLDCSLFVMCCGQNMLCIFANGLELGNSHELPRMMQRPQCSLLVGNFGGNRNTATECLMFAVSLSLADAVEPNGYTLSLQ